jgi:MFS family permease
MSDDAPRSVPADDSVGLAPSSGPVSHPQPPEASTAQVPPEVDNATIYSTLIVTLLVRLAGRVSFSVLVFYLGSRIASAGAVLIVLESYYVTEVLLSPVVGAASDRYGRRIFLMLAPAAGALACIWYLGITSAVPGHPGLHVSSRLAVVLVLVLIGRLVEGASTGIYAPAALGALVDVTAGHDKLRVRVLTIFEVATVGALALAIPVGGLISAALNVRGFIVAIALNAICIAVVAWGVTDHGQRETGATHALRESLSALHFPGVRAFLPAWLALNAVVGAWITAGLLILAYSDTQADKRFPHQLLYGGFTRSQASLAIGAFGALFLIGMGLWTPFVTRLRRTSIMLVGLGGLAVAMAGIAAINGIGGDIRTLPAGAVPWLVALLVVVAVGLLMMGGFAPAALTQMGADADEAHEHSGAVLGLYSFALGLGQLTGAVLGGFSADRFGMYGLIIFSVLLGVLAVGSVLIIRLEGHDRQPSPAAS